MNKNIIIEIANYRNILDNNKNHFDKLYTICKEIVEGGVARIQCDECASIFFASVFQSCSKVSQHLNIDNTINELIYKQYKWENSTITFLKHGNMGPFGKGKYSFINEYLIKCCFDGRDIY